MFLNDFLLTLAHKTGDNSDKQDAQGGFPPVEIDGLLGETAEGGQAMTLSRQLRGYRLTTADILYWRPDHPSLLQSFIWQELDLAPKFPVLSKFLPMVHCAVLR